jgi:hypothetical protein
VNGVCSALGAERAYSCCRSVLGSVDSRKVEDDTLRVAVVVP